MTTTVQRPVTRPHRRERLPFATRAAAVGCSTLLTSAVLAGPAAASVTESPGPAAATVTESPAPSEGINQSPQLTCGGVMTQAGSTESVRVSVTDPDGDPVTLSVGVSMLGVQPTVSGHVITYQAPTATTGQDNFVVRASDARGGEANCEIGVLVQAGAASPPPAPTPTPPPTTPAPSDPAPEPSTGAPTEAPAPAPVPTPEPISDAPTPGDTLSPAPTSRPPSTAPTAAPVTPGGASEDQTVTSPGAASPARGTGRGEGSGTGTPGGPQDGSTSGPQGGSTGDAGATRDGAGGTNGAAPGPETGAAQSPDSGPTVALPPRPDPGAGTVPPWAGVIPMELGAGSLRTLSTAQELFEGIDSGKAPRDGGDPETGEPATAPSAADGDPDARVSQAGADRLADTGASWWLFAMVGALMTALVGLALMALPRGRRQH